MEQEKLIVRSRCLLILKGVPPKPSATLLESFEQAITQVISGLSDAKVTEKSFLIWGESGIGKVTFLHLVVMNLVNCR